MTDEIIPLEEARRRKAQETPRHDRRGRGRGGCRRAERYPGLRAFIGDGAGIPRIAAAIAARTLGPDHSVTKALARAAQTMEKVDFWKARLAIRTLRRDQREAMGQAAED